MANFNNRALDEPFLNEFLNGRLSTLLKIIQKDDTLVMCLRGDYVTVYYRSCRILNITSSLVFDVNKKYDIIYDLKHAIDFTKDKWLEYFRYAKQKIDQHSFEKRTKREKVSDIEKKRANAYKLEKDIQQTMFRENSYDKNANETEYFIFDIEYNENNGRFDALALCLPNKDRNFGKEPKLTNLAIIELKAGKDSIEGSASLTKHYDDVTNFVHNIDKSLFMKDMKNVFDDMVKLKLINIEASPEQLALNEKSEIEFIFVLANYNANSVYLQRAVNKMDANVPFKTYFATSSYMGYGLYKESMISLAEMKAKFETPSLTIHRGTEEIGGSAVEVKNNETRLLFDFGIPLETMEKDDWKIEDYKLPIEGLYLDEEPKFDAVFLTHAHPDHYGLMPLINPEIPIYVSQTTYDVLTKISNLLPNQNTENLNLHVIEDEIDFKDIKVKAHRVDHSIAGACAYEIKTWGKTVVYSGDIRFHGRASWQSFVFENKIKNPDYLIMEGTTLGRAEQDVVKEQDLEDEFVKIFKGNKLPLVQFSPQNIDRFVTVYRACKKAGKTLVIDAYTAYVLEVYSSLSEHIPQFNWEYIMVNFAKSSITQKLAESEILFRYKDKKITIEEIVNNPEKYVIKGNWAINKQIFNKIPHDRLEVVFSMWRGYLDRPNQFEKYDDIKVTPLHTSGHAYVEDLQKFVYKVQPKNLIPIHTEYKDKYKELFNANVIALNDVENLSL